MINSLSITDVFWIEIKEGRISFQLKHLPPTVHFTISFNPNNPVNNFHVSKNIGDGTNKPYLRIAEFGKDLIDKITPFIPTLVFTKMYKPVYFKKLSRQSRKNIRLIFFDELENSNHHQVIEDAMTNVFKRHTTIKRQKAKLNPDFAHEVAQLCCSKEMQSLLLGSLKVLTKYSFQSNEFRSGILITEKRITTFIAKDNRCYSLNKRINVYELLTFFMKPALAKTLLEETEKAITNIKYATTHEDTIPFNNPIKLFIEE